jgi:hypothetical protein
MKIGGLLFAAAALSFGAHAAVPPIGDYGAEDRPGLKQRPRKQRRGKGQNNRRGKGLTAKAKKRPNRLTISKRVRRKHRRAA